MMTDVIKVISAPKENCPQLVVCAILYYGNLIHPLHIIHLQKYRLMRHFSSLKWLKPGKTSSQRKQLGKEEEPDA